jgi:uncharacterized membrane protein
MIRTLYKISTFLILALGLLHIALTPRFVNSLTTQAALWFVSGGVLMVFASFFNFILMKAGREPLVVMFCHTANIIVLLFASAMFLLNSLRTRPSLSAWLVLLLFVFETVAAFRRDRA